MNNFRQAIAGGTGWVEMGCEDEAGESPRDELCAPQEIFISGRDGGRSTKTTTPRKAQLKFHAPFQREEQQDQKETPPRSPQTETNIDHFWAYILQPAAAFSL